MTDKYLILDGHSFTNERVTGNLAPRADFRAPLNFDKATDPRLITDLAAVKIHEAMKLDRPSKFDIGRDPQTLRIRFAHRVFSNFSTSGECLSEAHLSLTGTESLKKAARKAITNSSKLFGDYFHAIHSKKQSKCGFRIQIS